MDIRKYLGTAMASPTRLVNGKSVIVSDNETIKEAVITLLTTPKGTRLFLPEYGSRLEELLFEPNDEVLYQMARLFIKEAINNWEKRIKFEDVKFKNTDDYLECKIIYRILASNEIESFVYPFYRKLKY